MFALALLLSLPRVGDNNLKSNPQSSFVHARAYVLYRRMHATASSTRTIATYQPVARSQRPGVRRFGLASSSSASNNRFQRRDRQSGGRRRSVVVMAERIDVQRVEKSDAEWSKQLNKQEFQVLRKKGTEPARTGEYDKFYPSEGHFVCRCCGTPLYSAAAKFDSGCGWPAFDKCYTGAVKTEIDNSFGMRRIEIMCAACDGHLGHVFENEGFSATMERHCVNSVSVKYVPENKNAEESKVVDGNVVSSAMGIFSSPVIPALLGVYVLSDVVGKGINFFAERGAH